MNKRDLLVSTTVGRRAAFHLEPQPNVRIGLNGGIILQEYFRPEILEFSRALNEIAERASRYRQ